MPSHAQRPQAFAAFLNPALVGSVQAAIAQEYELKRGRAMVWPLALVLPVLVLHEYQDAPADVGRASSGPSRGVWRPGQLDVARAP